MVRKLARTGKNWQNNKTKQEKKTKKTLNILPPVIVQAPVFTLSLFLSPSGFLIQSPCNLLSYILFHSKCDIIQFHSKAEQKY